MWFNVSVVPLMSSDVPVCEAGMILEYGLSLIKMNS